MIAAMAYSTFMEKPKIIQENTIYNFGLIYNNIKEVILYFEDDKRTTLKSSFDCGFAIGALAYYIFSDDSVLW